MYIHIKVKSRRAAKRGGRGRIPPFSPAADERVGGKLYSARKKGSWIHVYIYIYIYICCYIYIYRERDRERDR